MRSSTPAIVVYSTAGTIIGWDTGAELSFGYTAEDMMGQSIYNLVRDAGGPIVGSASFGTRHAVRCECIARDGTMLSVLSTRSPVVDAEQKSIALCDVMTVTGTVAVAVAVGSERPSHRLGANDQEHPLLKTIVETSPGVVLTFMLNAEGRRRFSFASAGAHELFGFTPAQLIENHDQMIARMHPDDFRQIKRHFDDSARTGASFCAEFRYRHPAHGEKWIEARGRPVETEEGCFLWNGVVLDVTERKRVEAHQSLLRRQLESDLDMARAQKLEALAALAGRIAHDFNNVLFAIVGNTTLALDALPISSPLRLYLREISGASARAVELVRQMLAFTQSMESRRDQSQRAASERPSSVPPPVSQTLSLPPPEGQYKRILFVDDDPMLVTLGKNVLSRLGYNPHAFEDARQALAAFGEDPTGYAAVVTDLSMPSMSGLELSQSLLAIRPDLPILMVSGYIGSEERANGERLGIRQLVSKPLSMQRLGELLSKLC